MKLTKILEQVMSEVGDATSALPIKKPNIKATIKKAMEGLQKTVDQKTRHHSNHYEMAVERKSTYTATGDATYAIEVKYDVHVEVKNKKAVGFSTTARIDFDVKGNKGEVESTNLNEQYKVIGAVTQAFLDFANQVESIAPLKRASIYAKADEGGNTSLDSKRARIYKIYIEKNLKNLPGEWKIKDNPNWGGFNLTRSKTK